MEILFSLLGRYRISTQDIFDAQLVATMLLNNITTIYTFNINHFNIFSEIEALKP
jgi:predicted nucleic acid-binding protein